MLINDKRHIQHYILLILGLAVFGIFMYIFRYNNRVQLVLAALVTLFYTLWGIGHHALEDRLNLKVALEYVLFSTLVFVLIFVAHSL